MGFSLIARFLYVAAGISLLLVALHAARLGWADLDALAAQKLLERWEREPESRMAQYWWTRGEDLLRQARDLAPRNADYVFSQGLWQGRRAEREASQSAVALDYRRSAESLIGDALGRRPTWAYAWSELAVNRFASDGPDPPTLQAFRRSLQWGPWEADVLRSAAWLSMQAWDRLPGDLQLQAWGAIRRAALFPSVRGDLTRLAKRHAWLDYLESVLEPPEAQSVRGPSKTP